MFSNQIDFVLNSNDLSMSDDNQIKKIFIDLKFFKEIEDVVNVINEHSLNKLNFVMKNVFAKYMTVNTSNDESQLFFIRKYFTINIVVN